MTVVSVESMVLTLGSLAFMSPMETSQLMALQDYLDGKLVEARDSTNDALGTTQTFWGNGNGVADIQMASL